MLTSSTMGGALPALPLPEGNLSQPSSPRAPVEASIGSRPALSSDNIASNSFADDFRRLNFTSSSGGGVEEKHLPDNALRLISSFLVAGEPPGHCTVHLLAVSGVCTQWRAVMREVPAGTTVGFDVLDNTFCSLPSIQRFRRLPAAQKEEMFLAGAQLLTGYSEVSFAGDSVADRLLVEVAARVGPKLTKIKLHNTKNVTDAALCTLIQSASGSLQTFIGEEMDKATGKFLVYLFNCKELTSATVASIPNLNWGPCKLASQVWQPKGLTKLTVRSVNLDESFAFILSKLTQLLEMELDGPARNIKVASLNCPTLHRVSYLVSKKSDLDEALASLLAIKGLKQLELIVRNFVLTADELRAIGMLPSVVDLRLDSFVYKQQPTLSRSSYSHVDNEGVKALVDGICQRWCAPNADMSPMKLSLCGATALTHDAVSALLRLPILTELDIGGCCRITAMDKMRLVAKVKAGREMLESGRRPQIRMNSRFPGLLI